MEELFKYFIEETNKSLIDIRREQDAQSAKIDMLLAFKWRVVGGAIVASSVLTIVMQLIFKLYLK